MRHFHDERLALPLEEGVLLWCMRSWVITPDKAVATQRLERMLGPLGAPDAAPYVDGLMFALNCGATRSIGIDCVCHPTISADERALLEIFALAQENRPFEALLLLREILTPEGARAAMRSVEGVSAALARAGLFLTASEFTVRHAAFPAGSAPGAPPPGTLFH